MGNKRERKPTHPGELIREDLLPELGITQDQLARLIGVSQRVISDIVNERRRITPDLAFRLARVFNSTPELWLNMQQAVDLWETQAVHGREYESIHPVSEMPAVSILQAQ